MRSLQTTSYRHTLPAPPMNWAVSASSQQYCEGKYVQDFEFPASSRSEICMTKLEIHTKWQVLYNLTFHTMSNQGGRKNICCIDLNLKLLVSH